MSESKKANVKGFFKKFKENREKEEQPVASLLTQASRDSAQAKPQVRQPVSRHVGYNLSPVDASQHHPLLPPVMPEVANKNLLVLDLDETLVHSSFKPVQNANAVIPIEIDGNIYRVYVKKRPYLDEFIQKITGMFEIAIFTASLSKYADPLLDLLDPGKLLGTHRLFREHCSHTNGAYVKDLSLLGRPLERVVIIDNSPVAYLFQPHNALPCTSWFDDTTDTELKDFFPLMEKLAETSSIYEVLEEYLVRLQNGRE